MQQLVPFGRLHQIHQETWVKYCLHTIPSWLHAGFSHHPRCVASLPRCSFYSLIQWSAMRWDGRSSAAPSILLLD